MVLQILYWLLLILCVGGYWAPDPYVKHFRFVEFVLFVIIGLKIFGMPT